MKTRKTTTRGGKARSFVTNRTPARVPVKLAFDRDLIAAFRAVCAKDGIGMASGIETMMRWAAQNGSLFPVMLARQALAGPLKSIHRQLTRALLSVGI